MYERMERMEKKVEDLVEMVTNLKNWNDDDD